MPSFDSRLTLIISPLPSLPDPTASSLLPAVTLSGLHVQDYPAPHSVMEHPKGQLDSTHTCSILENRQSIFRWWKHGWEETQCIWTSREQQGCEPSSRIHSKSHRWEQRETVLSGPKAMLVTSHTHVRSVTKSCLTLLRPHGLQPASLHCPWNSPGNNTGVGYHFLLQGIFLTQRSNRVSCISYSGRQILYRWATWEALSHTRIWVQTLQ